MENQKEHIHKTCIDNICTGKCGFLKEQPSLHLDQITDLNAIYDEKSVTNGLVSKHNIQVIQESNQILHDALKVYQTDKFSTQINMTTDNYISKRNNLKAVVNNCFLQLQELRKIKEEVEASNFELENQLLRQIKQFQTIENDLKVHNEGKSLYKQYFGVDLKIKKQLSADILEVLLSFTPNSKGLKPITIRLSLSKGIIIGMKHDQIIVHTKELMQIKSTLKLICFIRKNFYSLKSKQ